MPFYITKIHPVDGFYTWSSRLIGSKVPPNAEITPTNNRPGFFAIHGEGYQGEEAEGFNIALRGYVSFYAVELTWEDY